MFDKEIEAIAKCTELVKELDDDSKVRVIKYLIERFGIGATQTIHSYPPNNHQSPSNNHSPQLLNGGTDQYVDFTQTPNEDYPTLKDLLIKNYPKTETEWILCYAFYASKYGSDTFKRQDIIDKYKENNRLSTSASANLGNNLSSCIRKDWMKSINDTEFILKQEGIDYAKEVLKGKSTAKEVKQVKRKNNSSEQKSEE